MNYSEMSDDKINFHIFERLFGSLGEDRDMLRIWQQGKFQPCNSWTDAGPIIVANAIDLIQDNGQGCALATSSAVMMMQGEDVYIEQHPNPLRAAMIVFLMMQEKK